MKKIITLATILLTVCVALSTNVFAQSRMTEEQKEELKARYEAYREKLNLSDEQAVKVEEINTEYFEGLADLKNSNAPKFSKYKKFKSLQSTRDKKMKDVLDDEQYKLFKEFQAEMKEEFKENRRNSSGSF